MKQLVIMPGGFHPFHAGHLALYQSAEQAFPGADVKVAATNDTSARPFPFALKEKLAQLAGVPPGKFYQVKSPFRADEITKSYDPADTQLIFVRSEKDADKPPVAGGTKKDGTPAYLQPISDDMAPMNQHAYMVYLPTVEFGPGMTSATEIRSAWPTLNPKRKTALVMSLYPATQSNPKLAATVVKMLDTAMGAESVAEGLLDEIDRRGFLKGLSAAAAGVSSGVSAQSGNRDTAVEAITKMAGTAWDMRRLGWSRSQAMNDFENKMGYKGELLRVAGLVCNFAWSVPKDHYTRNEFVSNVRQQALKNLPGDQPSTQRRNTSNVSQQDQKLKEPSPQDDKAAKLAIEELQQKIQSQKNQIFKKSLDLIRAGHEPGSKMYSNTIYQAEYNLDQFKQFVDRADFEKLLNKRWPDWLISYSKTKQLPPEWIDVFNEGVNQEVAEANDQTNDSELNAIKNYAKRHYPNLAADPESAFDKWVQRSLMHSNVDDHEMDQKIRRMAAEIAGLKTKIQSLKQQANDSADYLDESR